MAEREQALKIANMWLEFQMNPLTQMVPGDPDCDACVLARQYIRATDHLSSLAVKSWMPENWHPIDTAPKMQTVILFAATDIRDGEVKNWKTGTGFWHTSYEDDAKHSPWEWEGRQLMKYEVEPTHWMPLPAPPAK